MFVQLDSEQVTRLVFHDLKNTLDYFHEYMEEDNPSVFSMNEITDKIQIQKHIEAIKLILEWYAD